MMINDFTGNLLPKSTISIGDTPFYLFVGKYSSTDFPSSILFKGSGSYNCFQIDDLLPVNTNYYPTMTILDTATLNITNILSAINVLNTVGNTAFYDVDSNFKKS